MRLSWDEYYLGIAAAVAKRSADPITQVGAVCVRDSAILATGYNGFVAGLDDRMDRWERPAKYNYVIHAEMNALLNAAKSGQGVKGATMFCTLIPCLACFQAMAQAGIVRVLYAHGPETGYQSGWLDTQLPLLNEVAIELRPKIKLQVFDPLIP